MSWQGKELGHQQPSYCSMLPIKSYNGSTLAIGFTSTIIRRILFYNTHGYHDYVIKWKHFSRICPLVWGIHWSPVNSPHKGQWRGALCFLWSAPEQTAERTIDTPVVWDAIALIMAPVQWTITRRILFYDIHGFWDGFDKYFLRHD